MTRPYRPSNGSEGLLFQHEFCDRCIQDRAARAGNYEDGCPILAFALMLDIDDEGYPSEWVADGVLGGRCTAFEQDPELPAAKDDPRTFPLPSEIVGAYLRESARGTE